MQQTEDILFLSAFVLGTVIYGGLFFWLMFVRKHNDNFKRQWEKEALRRHLARAITARIIGVGLVYVVLGALLLSRL